MTVRYTLCLKDAVMCPTENTQFFDTVTLADSFRVTLYAGETRIIIVRWNAYPIVPGYVNVTYEPKYYVLSAEDIAVMKLEEAMLRKPALDVGVLWE